jgi:hypothetical protein
MDANEAYRLLLHKRGADVPDPPLHTEPTYASKGHMTCECGARFDARQFDAWYEHRCAFARED